MKRKLFKLDDADAGALKYNFILMDKRWINLYAEMMNKQDDYINLWGHKNYN